MRIVGDTGSEASTAVVFGFGHFDQIRLRGCSVGCWFRGLAVEIAVIRDLAAGVSSGLHFNSHFFLSTEDGPSRL